MQARQLTPTTIGRIAAQAVGALTVFARFERALYARDSAGRIVCVVACDLGDGAIQARLPGPLPDLPDTIELAPAPIWTPPALPAWRDDNLVAGLSRATTMRPAKRDDVWTDAFAVGLAKLSGWVKGSAALDACRDLIGLGPGLTPSGDDALGGAAIALHVFGLPARANELGAFIRENAPCRTSDISMAHLNAAAAGEGSAAFHDALRDLVTGGDFASLERIGASSGWDAMDGAIAVLSPIFAR
ncbi:MAG: DUF2877 domain-containing protein [Alphaproteobacteria bacterium]|nr:DUF2877 domain-containing protein [Alphaproteobacteria bacterium]MCA0448222.1 DUF2877 domain-containing protein [Pseudomonadota bacterium]